MAKHRRTRMRVEGLTRMDASRRGVAKRTLLGVELVSLDGSVTPIATSVATPSPTASSFGRAAQPPARCGIGFPPPVPPATIAAQTASATTTPGTSELKSTRLWIATATSAAHAPMGGRERASAQ